MTIFETYGKEIVSLLIPFITWVLNTFFKAKAKLLLASPHMFTFLVQQPLFDQQGKQVAQAQTVHTNSFVIMNAGKGVATNIELVFNWKPLCVNVWPPRHFKEQTEPDNRYILLFDSLAPNEDIKCELLSINNLLPDLLTVRSDQCIAKTINMYPQPVMKNWQRRLAVILMFAGSALIIYLFIVLLQYLILKTPLNY